MDLNDSAQAGVKLADLIAAAEHEDHLLGRSWSDLVAAGVEEIRRLRLDVGRAQDRAEAVRLVAEVQRDAAKLRCIAVAATRRPADVSSYIAEIAAGVGQVASRLFQKALDAEVAKVEELIDRSNTAHRTATLDALLRPISVTGLKTPRDYLCDKDGVCTADGKPVAPQPILLIGAGEDAASGSRTVEVAWIGGGKWRRSTVDRRTIMDTRSILRLADEYAPVSSVNAAAVVGWLAAFEAENASRLAERVTSRHMGWVGDAFVVGARSIGGDVTLIDPHGEGDAFRAEGSEQEWRDFADETLSEIPMAMAMLYASACTPLLAILGAPGFVVDLSGTTTRGKTTVFKAAASVWGNPDMHQASVIKSWDSASVGGIMTRAWLHQSIPVMLDDTKRAKRSDVVADVMYHLPGGQDRSRLDQSGDLKATRQWRTVLLSTGEASISSFSRDGGAQARTICLRGEPLGEAGRDAATGGPLSARIERTVLSTYGHCGPALVEWLVANRDRWPDLRGQHEKFTEAHAKALGSSVGARVAGYIATIELAAYILHHEMRYLKGGYALGLEALLEAAARSVDGADIPREALDHLWAWIASNESKFFNMRDTRRADPPHGWVGRWDRADGHPWEWVGVRAQVVASVLSDCGYPAADQVEAWRLRGWLVLDSEGKHPKWGPRGARVMVFRRGALTGSQEGQDDVRPVGAWDEGDEA